ncbi:hypothetical protein QVD99_001857 [Batrachochytrium dendrobatidis]|nr:hypothetical protein O5D80_000500 [Batrachochytrium dendrobatidis]KAK5672038.1 hypothetical protein QVD99_001857 [Batrachochytrium dendrobatidis]
MDSSSQLHFAKSLIGKDDLTDEDLVEGFVFLQILSLIVPSSVNLSWYTTDAAMKCTNLPLRNHTVLAKSLDSICKASSYPSIQDTLKSISQQVLQNAKSGDIDACHTLLNILCSAYCAMNNIDTSKKVEPLDGSGNLDLMDQDESMAIMEPQMLEVKASTNIRSLDDETYICAEPTFRPLVRWIVNKTIQVIQSKTKPIHSLANNLESILAELSNPSCLTLSTNTLNLLCSTQMYSILTFSLFDSTPLSDSHTLEILGSDVNLHVDLKFLEILMTNGYLHFQHSLMDSLRDIICDQAPFYESIHANIISALLSASLRHIDIATVVNHLTHNFTQYNPALIYPYDLEDAMLVWANQCIVSVQKHQSSPSKSITTSNGTSSDMSDLDDIGKDTFDGRVICLILSRYYPTQFMVHEHTVKWKSKLTTADIVLNWSIISKFTQSNLGIDQPLLMPLDIEAIQAQRTDSSMGAANSSLCTLFVSLLVDVFNACTTQKFADKVEIATTVKRISISRTKLRDRPSLKSADSESGVKVDVRPQNNAFDKIQRMDSAVSNVLNTNDVEHVPFNVSNTLTVMRSDVPTVTDQLTQNTKLFTKDSESSQPHASQSQPKSTSPTIRPKKPSMHLVKTMQQSKLELLTVKNIQNGSKDQSLTSQSKSCKELRTSTPIFDSFLPSIYNPIPQSDPSTSTTSMISKLPASANSTSTSSSSHRQKLDGVILPPLEHSHSESMVAKSNSSFSQFITPQQSIIDGKKMAEKVLVAVQQSTPRLPSRNDVHLPFIETTHSLVEKAPNSSIENAGSVYEPIHKVSGSIPLEFPSNILESHATHDDATIKYLAKDENRQQGKIVTQSQLCELLVDEADQESHFTDNQEDIASLTMSQMPELNQYDSISQVEYYQHASNQSVYEDNNCFDKHQYVQSDTEEMDPEFDNEFKNGSEDRQSEQEMNQYQAAQISSACKRDCISDEFSSKSNKYTHPYIGQTPQDRTVQSMASSTYKNEQEYTEPYDSLTNISELNKKSDNKQLLQKSDQNPNARSCTTPFAFSLDSTDTVKKSVYDDKVNFDQPEAVGTSNAAEPPSLHEKKGTAISARVESFLPQSQMDASPKYTKSFPPSTPPTKLRPRTGLKSFPLLEATQPEAKTHESVTDIMVPFDQSIQETSEEKNTVDHVDELTAAEKWERVKKSKGISSNSTEPVPGKTEMKSSLTKLDQIQKQKAERDQIRKKLKQEREKTLEVARKEQAELQLKRMEEKSMQRLTSKVTDNGTIEIKHASSLPSEITPANPKSCGSAFGTSKHPIKRAIIKVQSNRTLIKNALMHVCLAGSANESTKQEVMEDLHDSPAQHFVIIFKDVNNFSFRGLYSWDAVLDQTLKVYAGALGRNVLDPSQVLEFYKYDSGARTFKPVATKSFGRSVHAVAVGRDFLM